MTIEVFNNLLITTRKEYSVIPAVYEILVVLETDKIYKHIMFLNGTDSRISWKIGTSGTEHIIGSSDDPDDSFGLDNFRHNGNIFYKYLTSAPTTGRLIHYSW